MAHRMIRWLVAALVVVPLATACGVEVVSGTPSVLTNGLENMSPAQVQQAAIDALTTAGSVHITGTAKDDWGLPGQYDIRVQGTSYTGTITVHGAVMAITVIGDTGYFKTDAAGWQALGVPEAAELLADKWVKGPIDMVGPDEQLTIDLLVSAMKLEDIGLRPAVVQTTVGDERAVMVTYRNGDKLYVANTGTARPLRISSVGIGDLNLSEHGTDFQITAPPDAIDSTQP